MNGNIFCNFLTRSQVTKTGTLVYDLDSTWKKPYEVLILGRVKEASNTEKGCRHQNPLSQLVEDTTTIDSPHSVQPILGSPSSPIKSPEIDQLQSSPVDPPKPVPHHQVIVSVPCSIHSRKPPLDGELTEDPLLTLLLGSWHQNLLLSELGAMRAFYYMKVFPLKVLPIQDLNNLASHDILHGHEPSIAAVSVLYSCRSMF